VGAVIDLYASLPITDYTIECPNPYYRKYCEDLLKRIKTRELLQGVSLEFWKIGDVFILGELDEQQSDWKRFVVIDPDQVEVKTNMLASEPYFEMIPNDNLKRLVFDQEPRQQYLEMKRYAPDIITAVRGGKNVPLDAAHITHLKHTPTPYGTYGIPLMKRVFKTLMYKEMIRRAQFTIAERYVMPLKIFKLGTTEELPSQEEIDDMQTQITAVLNDPSLVLVTHQRFQADWQGIAGKTLQLTGEYDFIEREIISGLGVSRAFLDGCLDKESEVLTNHGWKRYEEINQKDDLIARINLSNEDIEWVVPDSYFVNEDYSGPMYQLKTNKLDMLVSPEHKIYVQHAEFKDNKRIFGSWEVQTAKEIFESKVKGRKNRIRKPFRTLARINHKGNDVENVQIGRETISSEDYAELIGYFISDGSVYSAPPKLADGKIKEYPYIQVSQKRTSRNWNKMNALMERLPSSWHINYCENSRAWRFDNADMFQYFNENFYCSDTEKYSFTKSLPRFIKNWNKDLLNILLEAAIIARDGSNRKATKKKEITKEYKTYSSVSKKLVDDIQEIAIKLGYATTIAAILPRDFIDKVNKRTKYILNMSNDVAKNGEVNGHYPTIESSHQMQEVSYSGRIWCMDVGGSHLFLARRNNKVFVSGNSGPTYANASIGGNAFLQKLENFRTTLKEFIEDKVFKPIAELNGWYDKDPDTDDEFLIIPEFKWDALRLQDEASRQQTLIGLRNMAMVSAKTVLESIHINPEAEALNLMEERDTIFDANRIMARQLAIQMGMQAQIAQQQMKMQVDMMNGGQQPQMPGADQQMGQPQGQDMLQGLPNSGVGDPIPSGAGFSPMQRATSRPPVAASETKKKNITSFANNSMILREIQAMKEQIQEIIDSSDDD
jgi:hypothetical protein